MASERPITFFDITVGDKPIGRIVFSLYSDLVPKTAENFRTQWLLLSVTIYVDNVQQARCVPERRALANQEVSSPTRDLGFIALSRGECSRLSISTKEKERIHMNVPTPQIHVPGR